MATAHQGTAALNHVLTSPLEEAGTPRKLEHLLEQWHQQEARGHAPPKEVHRLLQAPPSGHDTVGWWLAACCKRGEGGWVANSTIMTSYAQWCQAHGYEPKKAKGVSQALAVHGFEIGVNKRVADEQRRYKMARGVRGLVIR